jgi:DNA-directed RNA polymerase specialized sigma subunit
MTDVLEQAAQAHLAVEQAEQLRSRLLAERRAIIMAAHESGKTHEEIAAVVGLSKQRVARIVSGNAPPKNPRKKRNIIPVPVDL